MQSWPAALTPGSSHAELDFSSGDLARSFPYLTEIDKASYQGSHHLIPPSIYAVWSWSCLVCHAQLVSTVFTSRLTRDHA